LITVDFALHYSTPVVTVPASVYDAWSAGTNAYLLANKIKGTNDVDAFLSQYFRKKEQQWLFQETVQLTDAEQKILYVLQQWALSIQWLCTDTELSVAEVMEYLLHLEIKHLVYCSEPWVYAKK
jgi:predicted Rossmann fold nucleotide-binding protein DprA/Smf involved in DNA uptake